VSAGTEEPQHAAPDAVGVRRVLRLWWPLAASWMLMGAEMPLFAAVVARLADPEIHLAAYGSVVLPVAMLVEAPIIMLLSASTALSRDRASHARLTRFTNTAGAALTALHLLLAFTPLYDLVVVLLIDPPAEVVEPARLGLRIMTPWTWAIAYRRLNQGLLIRCERARLVGVGTALRLAANASVLIGGALAGLPGIVVGAAGVTSGVLAEAAFVGLVSRSVLREHLPETTPGVPPPTRAGFLRFYLPLAATPFLTLAVLPVTAAAISRMPQALASLAAWPAIYGLLFLLRAGGFAYAEVVVALAGRAGGPRSLRRVATGLLVASTAAALLLSAPPLAHAWFALLSGLPAELVALCRAGLLFGVALPALAVLQNALQGALVQAGRTRRVGTAVAVFAASVGAMLALGVWLEPLPGVHWALVALSAGGLLQVAWLARGVHGLARSALRTEAAAR
jgi:hypothetical protein